MKLVLALHLSTVKFFMGQIGKIQEIYQCGNKKDDVSLKVLWYYRPEEALGGRKVSYSKPFMDWRHTDSNLPWFLISLGVPW